jgi:hypothetical protein
MELQNFSFEQFYSHGSEVNATGSAGSALVELDSGNIQLEQGIIISVESEDITIETSNLSWEDEKRILAGSGENPVDILRSDGTVFSGRGFSADARSRTWTCDDGVEGSYVDTEIEDEETEDDAEGAGDNALDEAGESVENEAGDLAGNEAGDFVGNEAGDFVEDEVSLDGESFEKLEAELAAELGGAILPLATEESNGAVTDAL